MTAKATVSLVMLPPVQIAFGDVILVDGLMLIFSIGMPSVRAATCATFVFMPCPISIPPCVITTVPSVW
uniref:Uncharacterized protein n=1 Tax=Anopheles darlingi TaxID=43151 RepID=A0A2M4DCS6_ANODA